MINAYESLSEYYARYCAGEDCRTPLMLAVKLIAYADIDRWFKKRRLGESYYTKHDIADEILISVMHKVDKRKPDLRLRHEIFHTGRRLLQRYLLELRRRDNTTHELDDLMDQRDWTSAEMRPDYYMEAGTIMTPMTMLTIARAAYEVGYTKRHMYRIVAWGLIPWVWYGGRKVILYGSLRRFTEERKSRTNKHKDGRNAED